MKRAMIVVCLLSGAICTLISGCTALKRSNGAANAEDVAEVARRYYSDIRWALPQGDEANHAYELDRNAFLRQHRDEMLKTLQVVKTAKTQNVAVAFVLYSIGATIYRDVVWERKVDGAWRACLVQFFSDYDDDPFGDGKPDAAKALIKRTEDWQKASAKSWW